MRVLASSSDDFMSHFRSPFTPALGKEGGKGERARVQKQEPIQRPESSSQPFPLGRESLLCYLQTETVFSLVLSFVFIVKNTFSALNIKVLPYSNFLFVSTLTDLY